MRRAFRSLATHPRAALLAASVIFAVAAFLIFSMRDPAGESVSEETFEETTYAFDSTRPDLGAAVYFPQGTNPPLLDSLNSETNGDRYVAIESARWKQRSIEVFGTFRGGEVRCELLSGGEVTLDEFSSELQTVDDAFLQTFRMGERPDVTSYFVMCSLDVGEVLDRRKVAGSPGP